MAEVGLGILRRKVAAARAEVAEGGPGADRSWRLSLARAARDKLRTTLDFLSMSVDRRSLAELMEMPQDRSLIAVLDGPAEGLGVIVLSPPVLAAFIEAQTIGKVKSTEVVARKPTRTDAAMVAGLIDNALRGLEVGLADEADLVWAGGFRYASFLDDPRPLGLLLEDVPFKVLRAEVSLARGARTGEILLALPAVGRGQAPATKLTGDLADHGRVFSAALAERVNLTQCRLEAVLARLKLPLTDVMALSEGMVLTLPQAGLDRISLEGLDGRRVAEGRLGQNRGLRAVRLNEAVTAQGQTPDGKLTAVDPGEDRSMDIGGLEDEAGMYRATGTD
jgi:flagellar motor switch protein FliM